MFSFSTGNKRSIYLFAAIASTGFAASLLLFIFASAQIQSLSQKNLERSLYAQLKLAKPAIVALANTPAALDAKISDIASISGASASFLSPTDPALTDPEIASAQASGIKGVSERFDATSKKSMLFVAIPLFKDDAGQNLVGYLRFGLPTKEIGLAQLNLFWLALGLMVLSFGGAFYLTPILEKGLADPAEKEVEQLKGETSAQIQNLEAENNIKEQVLASFSVPWVLVDQELHVIDSNSLFSEIFGDAKLVPDLLKKRFARVFEGRDAVAEEVEFKELKKIYFVHINLIDDDSASKRATAVMLDVTSRVKFEELQDEFVQGIAQSLRSPIASIQAGAETLAARIPGNNESAPLVQKIRTQTERLAKLLNDIIYLSGLENSHLQMGKVQLSKVVSDAIAEIISHNGRKKIKLENLVGQEVEVWADEKKINHAIGNLLENSYKFTEDGGVVQVAAERHNGTVTLSVIDNGTGISKDDLPRIFERFYQPSSNGTNKGTTGLGLAIVKHIVEMHDGKVWAESEPGWWSKFYLTLTPAEEKK